MEKDRRIRNGIRKRGENISRVGKKTDRCMALLLRCLRDATGWRRKQLP